MVSAMMSNRVMVAGYFLVAGIAVLLLSFAIFRNPGFYQRTMRFGSPRGTDVRWAAVLGIVLGIVMLVASLATGAGLVPVPS